MIYLDYNATTPMAPEVLDAMLPYFKDQYGNASSKTYALGWVADEAVEQAKGNVAELIGANEKELVFTSGATESINLAMKGLVELYWDFDRSSPLHIVTVATEHSAVLASAAYLERKGVEITYLSVDGEGVINLAELESAMRPETILVAVMMANNETGVLQPIREVSKLTRSKKVLLLSDCTQVPGKLPLDVQELGIDLAAISAHKMYGPKGVGALYFSSKNPRVRLLRQMSGGEQQNGMRGGTLNVPGIVGMGAAAKYVSSHLAEDISKIAANRNAFEQALLSSLPNSEVNGGGAPRLPNVSNIALIGTEAKRLIAAINHELAFSMGSACHAASSEASHVLTAMGFGKSRIDSSIRLSVGLPTTTEEIEKAVEILIRAAQKLRTERTA